MARPQRRGVGLVPPRPAERDNLEFGERPLFQLRGVSGPPAHRPQTKRVWPIEVDRREGIGEEETKR